MKKRSNDATKKAQYMKRARNGMKGFEMSWIAESPFPIGSKIHDGEVNHANPTQRLICRNMWNRCSQWIVETEFTWFIQMRVVCVDSPRGDRFDDFEFTYTCTLRGNKSDILNDAMETEFKAAIDGNNAYPEGHKNKGVYSHCEFMATVVGV